MKHLYFVRHGESVLNAQRILAGHIDTPLTDLGRQQAHEAVSYAKGLGIDYVVSSPLSRALETAKIIAEGVNFPVEKIEINQLLIERSYGPQEGGPWDITYPIPNGHGTETLEEVRQRASQALEYVQNLPFENVLVVAHGTVGLALLSIIAGNPSYQDVGAPANGQIIQLI